MFSRARRPASLLLAAVLLAETPGPGFQAFAAAFERSSARPVDLPALPSVALPAAGDFRRAAEISPAPVPAAAVPLIQAAMPAPPLEKPISGRGVAAAPRAAAAKPAAAPSASAQADRASAAAAASVAPQASAEAGSRGFDAVYSGAAAPSGAADPVAAPSDALETQTLDVSSYSGLRSRLKAAFGRLPRDEHRGAAAGRRYRAAAELEIRPTAAGLEIRATPGATFLDKKAEARLPGIAPEVVKEPQFRALVESLYARLPESVRARGVRVSVHQMRVEDGAVTEGPHQDPHADYLAVWAVDRANAKGGVSVLSSADGAKTFERTLASDEILMFDNRANWHDATALARRAPWMRSRRDALVFAIKALPASAALAPSERAEARAVVAEELAKAVPDAARLKPIYESGDPSLQRALYRGFKRWSRFFSAGDGAEGSLWKLVKGASAPWAGHVYVKKLVSVLEFLSQARGDQQDAEKKAKEIHAADHAFSKAFVKAAEQRAPQGLDEEEAADAVSDSVIYPALIQPFMERRQKGAFDRKAVLDDAAQRLKDTVYLYSGMSTEDIKQVLSQPDVLERLDNLIDLLEEQMPDDPRGPASSSAAKLPQRRSRRLSGGAAMGLALIAGSALMHAFTGHGAEVGTLAALAIGALTDTAGRRQQAMQPSDEAPQPPQKQGDGLSPFLVDLTQMARRGEIPPIYLRDDETAKTVQILNQKNYNNVVLIGEPGVGKTAIAEGLALRIAAGKTGTPLDGQRVLLLDIGRFMAAAAGSPDAFAAAVEEIIKEAADGNTTLVIDEAHQLARDPDQPAMGMGSFFDQIKRVMTQGRLKLILATTRDEYNRFFARDRALESRSQIIQVEPVAEGPAMELVYRIRGQFESGVTISFGAAKAAVELTVRAFRFDALLRMAIKAMDTAATRLRVRPALVRSRILDARKDLLYHLDLLREARAKNDLERQENLVPQVQSLVERLAALQKELLEPVRTEVTREDVAESLQELGAPVHSLKAGTQEYIENVEKYLRQNLIGHDPLISSTIAAIKRRFAQPNLRKPIFSAVLLGPTGTGKTEFARLLARGLFGIKDFDKDAIKIDGGAHQHKHDISRIQGSPPGYVGFNATETLMDQVRRKPESIILVDEVEKMHPDILSLFLSILEDGTAKDSLGRPVDFSHTVILFTSNFGVPPGDYEKLSEADFIAHVRAQLKQPYPVCPFKPELLNRPSLVEIFTPLKPEEVRRIVELRLSQVEKGWKEVHGVEIRFPDREPVVRTLLEEGYDPRNGARPVNRAVDARLEAPLSELLLSRQLQRGDRITIKPDWTHEIEKAPADRRAPALAGATEESRLLAQRLEAMLASAPGPLTLDRVDEALDAALPAPADAAVAARTAPVIADGAEPSVLKDHRPGAADPQLKSALDALKKDAARAGVLKDSPSLRSGDADALIKAVKALAQKAKRLDLEAETRALEGPNWTRGFEEMEKEAADLQGPAKTALQKRLQEIVEAAGKSRSASLTWQVKDDALAVSVRAGARLTYEEEEKLLALLSPAAAGPARLEGARDGSLEQARLDVAAAGGRLGYSRDGETTTLWLEWPLAKAADRPSAAPEPSVNSPRGEKVDKSPAPRTAAPAAAPAPEAEAPAPEPVVLRKPRPARAGDRALDGDREQLVKKAGALMDTQYTEREVDGFGREIERTLTQSPELGSQALEETLWRGLLAFSKYVDELRRNSHQLEDIALDKTGAEARPAVRFREFYRLYRVLLAQRPDLAPEDARAKLSQALTLGQVASGRNNYYYGLNAEGQQALDWVWREVVETAFALSEERPQLVSSEWLDKQLAGDGRWSAYALERRSARLKDAALSDAAAAEDANAIAQALAKDPKRATERLTRDLYEAMDSLRGASAVPERAAAAARLALALAETRPELADARVTELLKQWLTPGAVAGPAGDWLGAQAVELGLMLERKHSGRSPWKEMETRLKDDPRWTQLVLIRHASVLADGQASAEAAIEAANELTKALAERPQDATPELGERLWSALDAHLKSLRAARHNPIEPAAVTLVGGRAMPVRRAREVFELYRRLLDARPDLAPAELPARLKAQIEPARVREWRPNSYEGFFRNDPRAGEAEQWAKKQLEELAISASAKRPDLETMPEVLALYTLSRAHLEEKHSFSLWGLWALLVGGAWTALFPILRFGNDVMVPMWAWWLAAAPITLHLAYNASRWLRERPAYAAMSARLRDETLRRMRAQAPIDTLRLIATFDQERGRWEPNAGRAELFKDLRRWPEFKQEADGLGLGRAVEGDEARLRDLAATLTDMQVPADTARDAGQRLQASLREHQQAADADLESVLRRAVEAVSDRVTGGKEALVYLAGRRPVPSLRSRMIVETYAQLLRARPELAGAESRAALQKLLSTRGANEGRSAGGWLQEQAAALAASVDEAQPGFVRPADAHLFYTESFRAAPSGRDGFRSPDSAYLRLLFAILGSAAAALMAGAWHLWHPAGFWFWVAAALGGAGALTAVLAWPLWLTQRVRAGLGLSKLDAALETRLQKSLMRGEPRAALDIVAELDVEREVWFPRPGHKKIFDALARDWPQFRAAAGLDKKK